jgi:cyclase
VSNLRLIARLDIKGPNLIKGMHLEGLRVMGSPEDFAGRYYNAGIDELIYMDVVASLYGRNHLGELLSRTARNIFVPITVGGGVRSVDEAGELLRAGADKVAINTAAVKNPSILDGLALRFGSQSVVLSVEAKRITGGGWEVYVENGREKTGLDVIEWIAEGVKRGVGEILLTSVDREGTRKGFDVELVRAIAGNVPVPVIASGGMGSVEHLIAVVRDGHADAVAMADVLHYKRLSLSAIREGAKSAGFNVREA